MNNELQLGPTPYRNYNIPKVKPSPNKKINHNS